MRLIGITGGICSGKSTFCGELENLGKKVIYLDKVAIDILNTNKVAQRVLSEKFSPDLFTDGVYNKQYFIDNILNERYKITPFNKELGFFIKKFLLELPKQEDDIFVESAIIFETEIHTIFDHITCIYCPPDTQDERLSTRGYSTDFIKNIKRVQINTEIKKYISDSFYDFTEDFRGFYEKTYKLIPNKYVWDKVLMFDTTTCYTLVEAYGGSPTDKTPTMYYPKRKYLDKE